MAGYIVQIIKENGNIITGQTDHKDKKVNGKVIVYTVDNKLLVLPDKLKIIGFWD